MAVASSAAFAAMLALDIPWVTLNARMGLYKGRVNGIVTRRASIGALWIAILLVNASLVGYIATTATRWWTALLACMFAGLAVYGTFNGTAVVLFDSWPGKVAAGDTGWGIFLFGIAGLAAFFASQHTTAVTERPEGQVKN